MTADPIARLLRESIPDGSFGGPRPSSPLPRHTTTPAEARRNLAALAAAVAELDRRPARPARHLRAVPDTGTAA